MSKEMNVASSIGMPAGVIVGFITSNISKVPEEKLRSEIEKNVKMMSGWLL